jgi:hypothetical protein
MRVAWDERRGSPSLRRHPDPASPPGTYVARTTKLAKARKRGPYAAALTLHSDF